MNRAVSIFGAAAAIVATFVACSAFDAGDVETKPSPEGGADGAGDEGGPGVTVEGGAPQEDAGADANAKPPPTFSDVVRQIPGLVGYWHLDEGGNAPPTDVVGGNQGLYEATVAPAAGLLPGDGDARATSFATGAVLISSGDLSSLRTFDKALTVGALVRVDNLGRDQIVVFKYNTFALGIGADGHAFLDVQRGGSLPRFLSSLKVTAGTTAFVVGAFDLSDPASGGTGIVNLWVNNNLNTSVGPALTVGPMANTQVLCIGGFTVSGGSDCRSASFGFVGTIDEVFLAKQAVSSATVENLTQLAGLSQ